MNIRQGQCACVCCFVMPIENAAFNSEKFKFCLMKHFSFGKWINFNAALDSSDFFDFVHANWMDEITRRHVNRVKIIRTKLCNKILKQIVQRYFLSVLGKKKYSNRWYIVHIEWNNELKSSQNKMKSLSKLK